MKRVFYLDNVRSAVVLLMMLYHVVYIFNDLGVFGGLGPICTAMWQDALLYFVYPWFMVLLFVISGMCSCLDLQAHPCLQAYLKKRTLRLLLPGTAGLFVFQWITGWVNMEQAGIWSSIPVFARYPIAALSGTGPLWFVQLLWLDDVLLVLLCKLGWRSLPNHLLAPGWVSFAGMGLLLWASSCVLNPPLVTIYRFGIYTCAFLIGYYVLSRTDWQVFLRKNALVLSGAALLGGIAYTMVYFKQDYTSMSILTSFQTNAYAWLACTGILGAAYRWWNHTDRFWSWMARNSYGLYIVHYVCLSVVCYGMLQAGWPAVWIYIGAVFGVYGLSWLVYVLLRQIPVVRLLVLGITRK